MIYLDNAATTMVHPKVERVAHVVNRIYGNAGTLYPEGRRARDVIESARKTVARHIGVDEDVAKCSVFFTSGATEGNNWCIKGAVDAWWNNKTRISPGLGLEYETRAYEGIEKPHIVTDLGEHHSVLNVVNSLAELGKCTADFWTLDQKTGAVDPDKILESVRDDTVLVSVMLVNNETGVRNPVEEIGQGIMKFNSDHGCHVLFHVDATQAVGKMEVDVKKIGCDMLTASGHKFHAGKGRGFVYIDPKADVANMMHGGGQQMGRRPGTEDTVAAACLAEALDYEWESCKNGRLGYMTMKLLAGLSMIEGTHFNGIPCTRSGIVSVWFDCVESEALLALIEKHGIICSAGSACTTGSPEPSHVLTAMGAAEGALRGTIRISIGAMNKLNDTEKAVEVIAESVRLLRE